MNLRFLAILILLMPTAYSVGMLAGQTGQASPLSGCCQAEEVVSCCEQPATENAHAIASFGCQCSMSPVDSPIPTSIPMIPLALSGMVFSVAQPKELVFEFAVAPPTAIAIGLDRGDNGSNSNTAAQAILGVWRI